MGYRLIVVVRGKNDEFIAASYQHWASDDDATFYAAVEKFKKANKGIDINDTEHPINAVNALMAGCKAFYPKRKEPFYIGLLTNKYKINSNGSTNAKHTITPVKTRKFAKQFPCISTICGRDEGMITLDEEIAKEWIDWAEMIMTL